jgi:hypothetical protein
MDGEPLKSIDSVEKLAGGSSRVKSAHNVPEIAANLNLRCDRWVIALTAFSVRLSGLS